MLIGSCIIVDAFRLYFCNKVCRLPTSPDTKRIDSKHQEHTDICRNVQVSTANKKRRHQNYDRYFAIYKMQSAATNADRQKRGAAVTAPHGAFRFTSGDHSGTCVKRQRSEARKDQILILIDNLDSVIFIILVLGSG